MRLVQTIGAAMLCMALAPAVSWAATTAVQSQPSNEIFAQQALPSVGGMQDPHAVTPKSLDPGTVYMRIKMNQASMMAMHHEMKKHPNMNCKIEPYEPGATFTMILVCR